MKGAAATNQGVVEVKTKAPGFFAIVTVFAAVLALGGGTAQAAVPCSVPSVGYLSIQSAVNDAN